MITVVALVVMGIAVVLSTLVVRKLIVKYLPGSPWQSAMLYLIPGLYGGAFSVMLISWRLF